MHNDPYQPMIERLAARFTRDGSPAPLRPAAPDDLQWLRTMSIPETIVAFFCTGRADPVARP